jgi:hypothetical protein
MDFKDVVLRSYPTGSRYICNPAPTDTDNDTVILVNGFFDYDELLINEGWQCSDKPYDKDGAFTSYRLGEENYIVTEEPEFFDAYVKATEAAKALNLLKKEDRIKLFSAVCNAGRGYSGLRNPLTVKHWDINEFIGDVARAAPAEPGMLGQPWLRGVGQWRVVEQPAQAQEPPF